MDEIRNVSALLREQLWFVPALFVVMAGGLAFLLLTYGSALGPEQGSPWWLYSGDASTAREVLSSLLSGLITMTSLVVSVTFVILTLAASQLGPRLISIFVGDRQIQSVLGLFIGTILYVTLVLRTVNDTLGADGVPHLAVTVATFFTLICLLALLFYIHKIANSIIADNVVEAVTREFRHTLEEILAGASDNNPPLVPLPLSGGTPVSLAQDGYLQVVNYSRLVHLAREHRAVFEVRVRAGHHVLCSGMHVLVHSDHPPDNALEAKVRNAFTVGAQRTPAQDPEHGVRQLVEIATRALSPGINDPFTAMAVIDRLGAVFEQVFERGLQPSLLMDHDGVVRVVADRSDVHGLLDVALHPIRQAGAGYPAVLIRIAETISALTPAAKDEEQRKALAEQLIRLSETASLGSFAPRDMQDIEGRIDRAWTELRQSGFADERDRGGETRHTSAQTRRADRAKGAPA